MPTQQKCIFESYKDQKSKTVSLDYNVNLPSVLFIWYHQDPFKDFFFQLLKHV